jgi:hypothetical protein
MIFLAFFLYSPSAQTNNITSTFHLSNAQETEAVVVGMSSEEMPNSTEIFVEHITTQE